MTNENSNNQTDVVVLYTNTGRTVTLTVDKNTRLDDILNQAYSELGEERRSGDNIFCPSGKSIGNLLDKTIQSVLSSQCKSNTIEIRGPTGGA